MISNALNVETACMAFGYESLSQFSREYARMSVRRQSNDVSQMRLVFQENRERSGDALIDDLARPGAAER